LVESFLLSSKRKTRTEPIAESETAATTINPLLNKKLENITAEISSPYVKKLILLNDGNYI
jgi:hypothetical protein